MKPFWKTNILAIDLIFQFIFIFIIMFIFNLLRINYISTHTLIIIISIIFFVTMGVIRVELIRRGIQDKVLGDPVANREVRGVGFPPLSNPDLNPDLKCSVCDRKSPECILGFTCEKKDDSISKYKLSDNWWKVYAWDIEFGLTVPMLLIISIINKKYDYLNIIFVYIAIYSSTDSTYKCLGSSGIGDGTAIFLALSVYMLLLINFKGTSKIFYPLISTIVVIISYIYRGVLGGRVGYLCI